MRLLTLNNGQQMPTLGIGTFDGFGANKPVTTSEAVYMALQEGYRHIDCAYAYNNEAAVGKAIRQAMQSLGLQR